MFSFFPLRVWECKQSTVVTEKIKEVFKWFDRTLWLTKCYSMKTTENLLKTIWQQSRHLERKLMRQKKYDICKGSEVPNKTIKFQTQNISTETTKTWNKPGYDPIKWGAFTTGWILPKIFFLVSPSSYPVIQIFWKSWRISSHTSRKECKGYKRWDFLNTMLSAFFAFSFYDK